MEIVFWVIVAIGALVIAYICALGLRYRSDRFAAAPDRKEHGVDLQARRKTYDDVT